MDKKTNRLGIVNHWKVTELNFYVCPVCGYHLPFGSPPTFRYCPQCAHEMIFIGREE